MGEHKRDHAKGGDTTSAAGGKKHAASGTEGADNGKGRALDPMSQASIEERLRTMFDTVAQEPVPDRFLDLLNQLDGAQSGGGTQSGGGA